MKAATWRLKQKHIIPSGCKVWTTRKRYGCYDVSVAGTGLVGDRAMLTITIVCGLCLAVSGARPGLERCLLLKMGG